MKKKIIVLFICAGIVLVIILKLTTNKQKINAANRVAPVENVRIPVTAIAVTEKEEEAKLIKTGKLAPVIEAKVLSETSGNLKKLRFNLGDRVQQGQTLAVIDTRLLQLELQKAEFNVTRLKDDLQTYTELFKGNAATKEKLNGIRQNYEDALNQAEQLHKQIADAAVKAPISGTVYEKPFEEGMFIATGTEIAAIVNMSSLKIQVFLTETEVYQVSLNQIIKFTTDVYPDKFFDGKVTFISPKTNEAYNYYVEISASNDESYPLRSGTLVNADFSKKTLKKVLLIPREALNESTQDASVYIVEKGKARLRKIKVGTEYGDNIQVISGLHPADIVITSGQINLKDGALVNISK